MPTKPKIVAKPVPQTGGKALLPGEGHCLDQLRQGDSRSRHAEDADGRWQAPRWQAHR